MSDRAQPAASTHEALLEPVERRMYLDLYAALPETVERACGISISESDRSLRLTCRGANHPFFNRVMGLEVGLEELGPWLDGLVEHYRGSGIGRWMLQIAPSDFDPALTPVLAARGLVPLRGWAKHAARLDGGPLPIEERSCELRIEQIGRESADAWEAILLPAFDFPAASAGWPVATIGRPGWLHYLAYADDEPAACAALFVSSGVATLTFAATRSEHRRRGAQTGLIQKRIREARRMGLDWIVTETDDDLPEKPNPSYRNVVRAGLPVRYVRTNWGPPPPAS